MAIGGEQERAQRGCRALGIATSGMTGTTFHGGMARQPQLIAATPAMTRGLPSTETAAGN